MFYHWNHITKILTIAFTIGLTYNVNCQLNELQRVDISHTNNVDSIISANTNDPYLIYKSYRYAREKARYINHKVLLHYGSKTINAAKNIDSLQVLADVYIEHSIIHTNFNVLDSALHYIFLANEISNNFKSTYLEARIQEATAYYHAAINNYDLAISHFDRATAIYKSIDHIDHQMTNLKKKGGYLKNIKKFDAAYETYEKVLNLESPDKRSDDYQNLILIAYKQNDTIKLNALFESYTKLENKTDPNSFYQNRVLAFKSSMDGDTKKELKYLSKANELALISNRKKIIINSFIYLGDYYVRLKDFDNAKINFVNAYEHLVQYGFGNFINKVFDGLVECCKKMGQYKEALYYKTKQAEYSSSFNERMALARILGNKHELNIAKKEFEIKELKVNSTTQKKHFRLLSLLTISAFGLLILVMYLYKRNQLIRQTLHSKNKALDQSLLEQQTMLQETHHRVKNNLQIIASLLNLQRKYTNEPDLMNALIDGRNRVKSIALIHQLLYQSQSLKGINVRTYADSLVSSLLGSYKVNNAEITFVNNIDAIDVHEDTLLSIGLIINELVTNAIKYAFPDKKGIIKIDMNLSGSLLYLNVSDNGIGFEINKTIDSDRFGYSLIKSLARKLGSELKFNNKNGTSIVFVFTKFKLA